MKKTSIVVLIPLVVLLLSGVLLKKFVTPHIESFLKTEIEKIELFENKQALQVESVKIQFFPPQLHFNNLKLKSAHVQPTHKFYFNILIPQTTLQLDLFALTIGRIQISMISILNPEIFVQGGEDNMDQSAEIRLPMDLIFKTLKQIPILNVAVQNAKIKAENLKNNLQIESLKSQFFIKNKRNELQLTSSIPDLLVFNNPENKIQINTELDATLTPEKLILENFKLESAGLNLIINGTQNAPEELLKASKLDLTINSHIEFEQITQEINKIFKLSMNPKGTLDLNSHFSLKSPNDFKGDLSIKTLNLELNQYSIGNSTIKGTFSENLLKLSDFKLEHPAGDVQLTQTEVELKKGFHFKSNVNINSLDIQQLFLALKLKKIPVYLRIQGKLPCEGDLEEGFDLSCTGSLTGSDFKVSSSTNPKISSRIIEINNFNAQGKLNVNPQGLDYQALVNLGKSKIDTEGKILFNEGFHIKYKSNSINLKDIDYLAGLSLSGNTSIEGETEGDSYDGTMDAHINPVDFQIDKYFLGNFSSELSFRSPSLTFKNIKGQVLNSKYSSDLDINLRENHIQGHFESDNFELTALQKTLNDLYSLPLSVSGSGPLHINFEGPLDFWKLNYSAEGNFRSVLIQDEYFEKLKIKTTALNGNLNIDEAYLQKAKSSLTASGRIFNTQQLDLFFNGQGFQLEESQLINKISPNIFGNLNFNSSLKGTIQNPEFFFNGKISQTVLKDHPYGDSQFLYKNDSNESRVEFSLFGNSIQTKILRQVNDSPQLKITSNITNWDFTKLLSLLGNETLFDQFQGSVSLRSDLESESGDFTKLTGSLVIDDFSIQRLNDLISNKGRAKAVFRDGIIDLDNFVLEGANSKITLAGKDFSLNNLNLSLKGKSDLKLTQLFLPFLDDIGGQFLLSVAVTGSWNEPEMLGSLVLDQAFFKLNKFPHPLEKIDSSITFSQKNILINSIHGQIAGGSLKGDGNIIIKEIDVIPTNIRLHLDNITLLIPDGVRSNGSADISITGDWFPFTLSGIYDVKEALISKNFESDNTRLTEKNSAPLYLPKLLQKKSFDPLTLDIKTLLARNISIKNSNVDGNINGTLQIKGPPDRPILSGKIFTEKNTKLVFRDRIFNVNTGTVEFKGTNEELNPDIFINAQSRIDEYDVNLSAQGPVKTLQIQLSSSPPLAESEITSLLAFGVTTSKLDQNIAAKDQTEKLGFELGQYIYRSNPLIRKKIKETLGVDVDIQTDFDSTTNTNVNKVTGSKKISDKVSVKASRTLGGTSTSYEAEATYRINSNLSASGKWKTQEATETQNIQSGSPAATDLFGVDLEFKREFK